MGWEDRLPGGVGDKKVPSDFDPDALLKGMRVELEHTDDKSVALEIAIDHLTEDPDYYDKLAEIHDETESEVIEPVVEKKKPDNRIYVEGDELLAEIGDVATQLFSRGASALGDATLDWLCNADSARGQRCR